MTFRFTTVPLKALSHQLDINVFCFFKMFILICGFSAKSHLRISCLCEEMENLTEITENDGIFYIFDQIKVFKVPLQIGHCHLCMKGHLKLREHYSPFQSSLFGSLR